jgi:hypothetical protein
MKDITNKIQTYYRYNGKFYMVSERKDFRFHDIFIDGRDYGVKIIESEHDLVSVAYMAPELYVILEEVTVQN